MSVKHIILCPYSHSDWAWICHRRWHEKRYIRAFEIALDLMDAGTGFTWFIDSWHEQFGPIRLNRPDLVERMKPHVAAGRFGLGPGAFTNPSPDACTGETLIRNVLYGQRHFRELFPDAQFPMASHIDCCGWSGQFPQLISKLGFNALHMDRPVSALNLKRVPRQFRWCGLDGTEIPVSRINTYALFTHSPYERDSIANHFAEELTQAEDLGVGETLMLFFGWDDDCLPLGEPIWQADLFGQLAKWNATHDVQARLGTPADFAREFTPCADSLAIIDSILDPVAGPRVTENGHENLIAMRVEAALAVARAEQDAMHYAPVLLGETQGLWEDVLSIYPHATAWLWERDHAPFVLKIRSIRQAARDLSTHCRRAAAKSIRPTQPGRPIVFFNPLPYDRSESCEFYFALDEAGATGFKLTAADGHALPLQSFGDSYRGLGHGEDAKRMRCEWHLRTVIDVPACGFATAYLEPDNGASPTTCFQRKPERLDIGPLSLDLDEGRLGAIHHEQLGDLLTGMDIVFIQTTESAVNIAANRQASLIGLDGEDDAPPPNELSGDFQNDGEIISDAGFEIVDWTLLESGPLGTRLFLTGTVAGNPTELEMFIHASGERIDCELQSYVIHPATGYLVAQVSPAFNGAAHADIPFGVESRDLTGEPFGEGHSERSRIKPFWGHSWADCSDGEKGVAFLSQPGLFGYRQTDNAFQHIVLKTIAPGSQAGGRWGNRNRTGLGCQRIRFAIQFHAGDWQMGQLYRKIEEYRQPLDGEDVLYRLDGDGPDTHRGLAVGPEHVKLSAFFDDDGAVILRLFETAGQDTQANIDLPFPVASATICDMRHEPFDDSRAIALKGNHLSVHVGAWEILTLTLCRQS